MGMGTILRTLGTKVKVHSPKIFLFGGIALCVGGTVAACIGTTKLENIVDDAKDKLNLIGEKTEAEEITVEEAKKLKTQAYMQAAGRTAKAYAPAAILISSGIFAILWSHHLLSKRNAALAAACESTMALFNKYRRNVVDTYGQDVDYAMYNDIDISQEQEQELDEEGKVVDKLVKEEKDMPWHGTFDRCFDESNPNWSKDAYFNKVFLTSQQNRANEIMKSRRKEKMLKNGVLEVHPGYLTAFDLYHNVLGFPADELTGADLRIGKMTDGACDKYAPDYLDLGIFARDDAGAIRFVDGIERSVWLHPNFDGVIDDKVGIPIYFKDGKRCDKKGNFI